VTLPRDIGLAFEIHDYRAEHLEACVAELRGRSTAVEP